MFPYTGLFEWKIFSDRVDPLHCHALSSRGRWLDEGYVSWQPDGTQQCTLDIASDTDHTAGCMLHNYNEKDIQSCLKSKQLVFIGDSVTRQLYFQMVNALDATLPAAPIDDDRKHADYDFTTSQNIRLSFFWDPFLNSSHALSYTQRSASSTSFNNTSHRPDLLVLGSGLWYLRYADTSGGLPAWEAMIENILGGISSNPGRAAELVVILPVEEVVPSKLSPERAFTMHPSDIDAMNSDLAHRIRPPSSADPFAFFVSTEDVMPVAFPSVFNQMLDVSQTEDGLHFSGSVVRVQANILLNLRCNDELPKVPPFDTTCCRRYPWPSLIHLVVLLITILCGPIAWFTARRYSEWIHYTSPATT
jgi:N-acetylneuraminate 9-O-acetyltransferase